MAENVLAINVAILQRFDAEILSSKLLLASLNNFIEIPVVKTAADRVVTAIKNECGKKCYISETIQLVNEYSQLLKNPITRNKICDTVSRKSKLANNFFSIVKVLIRKNRWPEILIPKVLEQSVHDYCLVCNTNDANNFEIDETGKKTCLECASEIKTIEIGNTHLDYSRVTIVGKFIYNRVLHFQDCIKQFQGKQNCKIPDVVFSDLDKKFTDYRLLVDSNNQQARYSKITKQHIIMFLKELKYVKHYENVNVIYYALTNKRVDDIGHLEQKLVEDFKELVTLYDNLHSKDKPEELDRKNFLNVQYLLFQLLRRHGYDCKIEDFSILKTTDRKLFHDKICCNLFQKLGWNFTPTF
jgi:Poxvirus Late Transcription Factor VLTF3 like